MRNDIIRRAIDVIRESVSDRRRLKELEEETGIPSGNWKNLWNGNQRPTAHMIEALARRWPQYAFWLATGITDEANGHTAPPAAWTCSQNMSQNDAAEAARKYFELKIYAQDVVYGMSGAVDANYIEKKNPTLDEMAAAKRGQDVLDANIDPTIRQTFVSLFGSEAKVWKKKYSDLDMAIAEIAFEKRLNVLRQQFFSLEINNRDDWSKYQQTVSQLQQERIKFAKTVKDDN